MKKLKNSIAMYLVSRILIYKFLKTWQDFCQAQVHIIMACKHKLTPLHMAKYKGNKRMLLSCTSKIAPGFRLTTEAMNTYFCYAVYERSRGKQLVLWENNRHSKILILDKKSQTTHKWLFVQIQYIIYLVSLVWVFSE